MGDLKNQVTLSEIPRYREAAGRRNGVFLGANPNL